MTRKHMWRNALLASFVVHCFLLLGIGWLGNSLFAVASQQEYMELDLISDVAGPDHSLPPSIKMQPAGVVTQTGGSGVVAEMTSDTVVDNLSSQGSGNNTATSAGSGETDSATGSSSTGNNGQGGRKNITPARTLVRHEALYPEDARQAGLEGTVVVKVEILDSGHPGEVWVNRSSGHQSLDEAAVQAVRGWRFVPAQETDSGRAIRSYALITLSFQVR